MNADTAAWIALGEGDPLTDEKLLRAYAAVTEDKDDPADELMWVRYELSMEISKRKLWKDPFRP